MPLPRRLLPPPSPPLPAITHSALPSRARFSRAMRKGYSPTKQPYPNTLAAAQAWCCAAGPSICGGVTHQAGKYDARAGCETRHCNSGCDNVSSWVINAPCRHGPGPSPPAPPCVPPCRPEIDIPVWPVPRSVTLSANAPMPVSSSFKFELPHGAPPALADAGSRYQAIIRQSAHSDYHVHSYVTSMGAGTLATASVSVSSSATQLTFGTDYSYSIEIGAGAKIQSATIFGAMYGMETLAQLCANGTLPAVQSIVDSPSYRYRGFMLDTGRRFVPKSDVFNSLEAMAASKMNVLHMHLSDDQRCAVDSLTYPNLTGSLAGDKKGSYTYVANYSRNYQLTLTLLVDAL
jgi:hypothetical protein